MRNHRPNYKPGFAEHPIPDPYRWVDMAIYVAIFGLAVALDVAALLSLGWVPK